MTSKEIINLYFKDTYYIDKEQLEIVKKDYNIVMKDLDRLETIEPLVSHCLVAIKEGLKKSYRKDSCTLFDNLVETFGKDYLKKIAKEWENE